MMNVDTKVLAKALALRLEKVLPLIISKEQTGFITGRQLFYNVRTLLNVIYSKETTAKSEVVISVDAEKAFDRVQCSYLFAVLAKFKFVFLYHGSVSFTHYHVLILLPIMFSLIIFF